MDRKQWLGKEIDYLCNKSLFGDLSEQEKIILKGYQEECEMIAIQEVTKAAQKKGEILF